ncbi:MAG: hypothetical protein ACTHMG_00830 [Sphingomonas sp.]
MSHSLRLMAAFALAVPTLAAAQPAAHAKKHSHAAAIPKVAPSADVTRVAQWVMASGDNHGLPWAIVDKPHAAIFLFDAKGKQLASEPVLIGITKGDEASPGVGTKKLSELGPAEKTTPAGRFLAKFGLPFGGHRVLWVDYADSVALHPIPTDVGPKEHRRRRMLSATYKDNRITFGCINVPKAFYGKQLSPSFRKKGGYVYVLPDSKPIDEVFPSLRLQGAMTAAAGD